MTTTTEWMTSNGNYGLGYYHAGIQKTKAEQVSAGLTRAERAYTENAHCYPRFERQKIRALLDENILSGAKQPDATMLQRVPMVPRVDPEERPQTGSSKAGSQRSNRSMRSNGGFSQRSMRSDASRRAGSQISSRAGAPSGAFIKTQTHGYPAYFGQAVYNTTNALYGKPGQRIPDQVGRGRETWMLGRGGGQITTFNNCLHGQSADYCPDVRHQPRL